LGRVGDIIAQISICCYVTFTTTQKKRRVCYAGRNP